MMHDSSYDRYGGLFGGVSEASTAPASTPLSAPSFAAASPSFAAASTKYATASTASASAGAYDEATAFSTVHRRAAQLAASPGYMPTIVSAREYALGEAGSRLGVRALLGDLANQAPVAGGATADSAALDAPDVSVRGTFRVLVDERRLERSSADNAPMLKLEPGRNVKMLWPNARVQAQLESGAVKYFPTKLALSVFFKETLDHVVTVHGVRAREGEGGFGEGEGWLRRVVTARDIFDADGTVKMTLMDRPMTEDKQHLLRTAGPVIGRLADTYQLVEKRGFAIVDAESPIYHFYIQQRHPVTGAPLNKRLADSGHGTVSMPLDKFHECCKETTQYFDEEFPVIDFAKFAITIQPLPHTDHLGKPVGASFSASFFTPREPGKPVKAVMVDVRGDIEFVGKTYSMPTPAAGATPL